MTKVTMFSSASCPFCVQAAALLHRRGVSEIDTLSVDADPQLRAAMQARTGRRSVPQIFIGSRHIGGFDDLAALDRAGELLPLLHSATAQP